MNDKIEPTGMIRLEWYLARILATMKNAFSKSKVNWGDELIQFKGETVEQTEDQIYKAVRSIGNVVDGNNRKS